MAKEQRLRALRHVGTQKQLKMSPPPPAGSRPEGPRSPTDGDLSWDSHSEKVAANAESAETNKAALVDFDWYAEYIELTEHFNWRIAAYIAWLASPRRGRKPQTQQEFAELVGLKSDRVIRDWRKKQPEIEKEIIRLQASPLLSHRRDIYEALVDGALDVAYGHQDRKLALELLGDYRPKGDVKVQMGFEFTADELAEADRQLAAWEATQESESR